MMNQHNDDLIKEQLFTLKHDNMKRTLLIFAALFAMVAYAQEPLRTAVRNIDPPYQKYVGCIDGSGNCRYLIFRDRLLSDFIKLSRDIVVEVAKDGSKSNVLSIERNMDYKYMTAYEDNENLYMLYRRSNSYTREFTLYLNTVPKEADIDKWKPKELLTLKRDLSDGFQMRTAVSPDKSKVALLLLQVKTAGMFEKDKSDKLKGSAVMVFEGDKIKMSKPLEFDVENNTLQFLDLSIDDNGEIFLALASFNTQKEDEGKKGSPKVTLNPNETVHIYKITEDEVFSSSSAAEFGHVSNGKLLVTQSGQTILGGYYSPENHKPEEGSYLLTIDASFANTNISNEKFPEEYFTYKHPKATKNIRDFRAVPIELFAFENGTITLLGEMHAYQSNMVTLFNLAGPTLVSMADNTGNLTDFQMVTKHQITSFSVSPSQMFSYHAIMKDNLVHFIYTDNLTNLTTGTNEPLEIKDYSFKGKCAAHRTLDSEGHLSEPEMLMDYTAYKSVLFVPLSIESDGLWIYHSEKNDGTVSWLPHNF